MKRNLSQKGSRSGIRIGRRRKILVVYKERPKQSIQRHENSSIQQEYKNGIQQEHQAHEQPSEHISAESRSPGPYQKASDTTSIPLTYPDNSISQRAFDSERNPSNSPYPSNSPNPSPQKSTQLRTSRASERIRKPTKPSIHYHTHYHFHTDKKTPNTMPGHQRGQSSTGTPQNPPTMPAPPLPTDSTNGAMTMDAFINAIKVIFERDREREERRNVTSTAARPPAWPTPPATRAFDSTDQA